MGAPRQSRRDAWDPSPAVLRYRAYKDELRLKANLAKYVPGDTLTVLFYLPMPPSWSAKKRQEMAFKPHQQKPDADNLVKGFLDTLLPDSDCHVYEIHARKQWAEEGKIVVFEGVKFYEIED